MGRRFGVLFGRGRHQEIDDGFARERYALECLEIPSAEVDLDEVVHDAAEMALDSALSHLPRKRGRQWLYRGWMLPEEDYRALYEAMEARGERLVVHPSAYATAAYLPEWAPLLCDRTPESVWTDGEDIEEAWELAQTLGPQPWIVKDHMKSARQQWDRACFVPEGTDRESFAAICEALLDFHGDRFQRGFVIRRFVTLRPLPYRAAGHPIFDEYRAIFWKSKLVSWAPYHDIDPDALDMPARFPFPDLGRIVPSPFFTADVGRLDSGGFTLVELNDGGCSTLPAQIDPVDLYEAILDDPP